MKKDKFRIVDESGDKKYFTIIPNYILNHSTLWDREVYIQMKRIAGEGGTCWASRKTLAIQCGMSERRLDKSLRYLTEHKWIERIGKKEVITKGGIQEVNEYKISDLWNTNNSFYQEKNKGVAQETIPKQQRGSTDEVKGVAHGAYKEELREEEPIISNAGALRVNPRGNYMKERKDISKKEIVSHYSNGENKCALCGFADLDYLEIDHLDKSGSKHRKENNLSGGVATYRWLIRNNYPQGFRVLCRKCNNNQSSVAGLKVNDFLDLFKELNPSYERIFSNKTQRSALERLISKYGEEKVKGMIQFAVTIKNEQYAPTITTPYELEKKLGQLIMFYNKQKSKKSMVVKI